MEWFAGVLAVLEGPLLNLSLLALGASLPHCNNVLIAGPVGRFFHCVGWFPSVVWPGFSTPLPVVGTTPKVALLPLNTPESPAALRTWAGIGLINGLLARLQLRVS